MRRSPIRFFAAICLLLPAGGQTWADEAAVACTLSAWSTDKDPRGLNVRAAPDADSPVIATLPPPIEAEGEAFAAEVSITGARDGWFRIAGATLDNYFSDEEPKIVFEGEGWVSGRYLGLGLNRRYLYREPSTEAAVVADLFGPEGRPDSLIVDRLHACSGDWVEVEGSFFGARHRGWASGTCANQMTTCP